MSYIYCGCPDLRACTQQHTNRGAGTDRTHRTNVQKTQLYLLRQLLLVNVSLALVRPAAVGALAGAADGAGDVGKVGEDDVGWYTVFMVGSAAVSVPDTNGGIKVENGPARGARLL